MHVAYSTTRTTAKAVACLRKLLFLIVFLITPITAFAQGKITGEVTDENTGEPLIGVNVVIQGTTQGTTSDIDGNYVILNVRPGEHTLEFSYIRAQARRGRPGHERSHDTHRRGDERGSD